MNPVELIKRVIQSLQPGEYSGHAHQGGSYRVRCWKSATDGSLSYDLYALGTLPGHELYLAEYSRPGNCARRIVHGSAR